MRNAFTLVAAILLLAVVAPQVRGVPGDPAARDRTRLAGRLETSLDGAGLPRQGTNRVRVGIQVLDLASGDELFAEAPAEPLNPASNAKLIVAAAALWTLGPAFTARTTLLGTVDGEAVAGDLVLQGRGDPTLTHEDLWDLALQLRARGVARVRGGIRVDDRYFGDGPLPFAFDSQPEEDAAFRAPVGAASIDANAIDVWIGPGTAAGDPARSWTWPENYLDLTEEARTVAGSGNRLCLFASAADAGRTAARIWGTIGVNGAFAAYDRRIDDPVRFAGETLRATLQAAGITVEQDTVRAGAAPEGALRLAEHESEPLSAWLWKLGKDSSNFHAEQLLRIVGAEARGVPGTAELGAEVARDVLSAHGVPVAGLVLRNGSGLFEADEVSPQTLAGLLRAIYRDAALRPEFLAQLSIAGVDGTAAGRLRDTGGLVRVKTGTLAAVSALSGYALAPDGTSGYVFSVLVNDARGRIAEAKALQDAVASILAADLR